MCAKLQGKQRPRDRECPCKVRGGGATNKSLSFRAWAWLVVNVPLQSLLGQDHPYRTITRGLHLPAGLAFNTKGWLYVANNAAVRGGNDVAEFPPGSMTPSKRQIKKDVRAPIDVAHYPALLP
jgi:hypothetical protein